MADRNVCPTSKSASSALGELSPRLRWTICVILFFYPNLSPRLLEVPFGGSGNGALETKSRKEGR